jgi:hypothetical protein
MIDASLSAMQAEAIKDGHSLEEIERADPNQAARFREVVRAMLQAAADVSASRST